MPTILPLIGELITSFLKGNHLGLVVVQLSLEFTELSISLFDLFLKEFHWEAVLALLTLGCLELIFFCHEDKRRRFHFLFKLVNTLLDFNFFDEVRSKFLFGFLQRFIAKGWRMKYTLVTKRCFQLSLKVMDFTLELSDDLGVLRNMIFHI